MDSIKVVIVDDSSFARDVIKGLLESDDEIKVVGEAENGKIALELVKSLKPDLVTMDVNMPVMDGLEATKAIMSSHAVPILVVTSRADADTAYRAISGGALEVIPKPEVDPNDPVPFIKEIKLLSKVQVISHIRSFQKVDALPSYNDFQREIVPSKIKNKIVGIASSTGGPKTLSMLLNELPANFPCPIVVAQHIPPDFVTGLTDWLNSLTPLTVLQGRDGDILKPGHVYFSKSDHHMVVSTNREISYIAKKDHDIYAPSCNLLLNSLADVYQSNSIGVELTGMGNDGVNGIIEIKKKGGVTIAQDEETSVVFGMPKAAIESGCVDHVLPVYKMGKFLINLIMGM